MKHARFAAVVLAAAFTALPVHAATFDLSTATLADINAAIDAGALSSEKLVGMYLKRIEAYDKRGPKINSVITLNPKALDEARALDAERKKSGRRSQLHGIPVMIKDLIDVAGLPTTAGYKPFGAPVPLRDAGVVARLHAAGAIVLAKVSTSNWFGNGFDDTHVIGRTLNPNNLAYSAGGSSNGPGASMAADFAAIAIGTDTGGSVQIPSAYNGIMGMVATQGMVTRTGIVPRGPTQDRAGPMGRSIYDVAATLSIIAGWDAEDGDTLNGMSHFPDGDWSKHLTSRSLDGKRIGVLREMFSTGTYDPEVKAAFDRALEDMRKAGAIIVDPVLTGLDLRTASSNATLSTSHPRVGNKTLPYELTPSTNAYLARLGPDRPWQKLEDMVQKMGEKKVTAEYWNSPNFQHPDRMPDYVSRMELRTAVRDRISDTLQSLKLDAAVLPYQSMPPPSIVEEESPSRTSGDRSNNLTSATGLPGVIVPGGYTKDNVPIAIQFVGRPWQDLDLLQVAYGYEQNSGRRKSPATTPALPGEKFEY